MVNNRANGLLGMWITVIALVNLALNAEAAVYSGGAGTEPNPYRIGNAEDWTTLATTLDDWDKHFLLTRDIDFGGGPITPVGTFVLPFTGVFDGAGKVLRNGEINFPTLRYIGLFCYLGEGGEIRNLGVEAVNVSGDGYVGGLAGYSEKGVITSCYTTGTVTGNEYYYIGGLVGYSTEDKITSCYTTGAVASVDGYVGGLVGYGQRGVITSCYTTGTVSGLEEVGGLVGEAYQCAISSCYATGAVAADYYAGGLVGYESYNTYVCCYATGAVTGTGTLGGFIGRISATMITSCYARGAVTGEKVTGGFIGRAADSMITSCYARGAVAGDKEVGGFIGQSDGSTLASSCYATGAVTGGTDTGGFLGQLTRGTFTSCYWDMDTSGRTTSAGGEGRTSDEMTHPYAANTYVGWDFAAIWAADTKNSVNDGYPYLRGIVYPDDGACGCSGTTLKNLSPKALLKRTLADWLLVGLSVFALTAFSTARS